MATQYGKEIDMVTLSDKTYQGPQGDKGDKGDQGDAGPQGVTGKQGEEGLIGKNGEDGTNGRDGTKGNTGGHGDDGLDGKNGEHGIDGKNGNPPKHQIQHNRIRFEQPDGSWGNWIDVSEGKGSKVLHRGGKVLESITITEDYTASARDELILADTTSAGLTVTLPLASNASKFEFHIKKIDSTENRVTVQGQGSDTIDDETSIQILTSERSLRFYSNGTNWYII